MEKNEICKKIAAILNKVMEGSNNIPKIYDEAFDDRLDSIQFVTLIVELENEFQIEIYDEDFDMEKLNTINKISELIDSYLK